MIAIQIGLIIFLALLFAIITQDEYKKQRLSRKAAKTHRFWTDGADAAGVERRKSVRIDTDIDVLYEIVNSQKYKKEFSVSRNISSGGINLALGEKLLPDTTLRLQLNIPQSTHPIITEGKIVWVKEILGRFVMQKSERFFSTGIKFVNMNKEDMDTLQNFINHHLRNVAQTRQQ